MYLHKLHYIILLPYKFYIRHYIFKSTQLHILNSGFADFLTYFTYDLKSDNFDYLVFVDTRINPKRKIQMAVLMLLIYFYIVQLIYCIVWYMTESFVNEKYLILIVEACNYRFDRNDEQQRSCNGSLISKTDIK